MIDKDNLCQDVFKRIAFVVATKDRPREVQVLLKSLSAQSLRPTRVIIVDASAKSVKKALEKFPMLDITYVRHPFPSASAQRNAGVRRIGADVDLIGFLDDDIVLEPDALENMLRFWQTAPDDLGGCAFNIMDSSTPISRFKGSSVSRWLGLYGDTKYSVTASGWQTRAGTVTKTTYVQWLPSTAAVWRKEIFKHFAFDEFFEGYSYLEDLDFSYSVSKQHRLAVLADARYWHFPSQSGRGSPYVFGKIEVRNRLYVAKKHDFSLWRCYVVIMIRLCMTLVQGFIGVSILHFKRFFGNCTGLARYFVFGVKSR